MRSPECVRKLNALKLNLFFSQDDPSASSGIVDRKIIRLVRKSAGRRYGDKKLRPSRRLGQTAKLRPCAYFRRTSVVGEITCLSEGQIYHANLRYLFAQRERKRGHPNLFLYFEEWYAVTATRVVSMRMQTRMYTNGTYWYIKRENARHSAMHCSNIDVTDWFLSLPFVNYPTSRCSTMISGHFFFLQLLAVIFTLHGEMIIGRCNGLRYSSEMDDMPTGCIRNRTTK